MLKAVTHPDHIADWGVFKEGVRRSFSDSDHVVMAQLKIKEIKQGHELVDNYVI
jgi:hypothetical protein